MAQVRSASDQRATRTSSTMATSILRRFSTCARDEHQRFARVEAGADRRHAQHTFDELGHHRPEALVHIGQLNLALTHAAVDDRSDQASPDQFEVSEDLGDLRADLIAGGAFAPEFCAALACCSASRANSQASFSAARSSAGSIPNT